MPRHQRHELVAPVHEDRVTANKEQVGPVLGDCCESSVEVVFAARIDHVDHMELKPMRVRRRFHLCDFRPTLGIVGIDEAMDRTGGGHQLAQRL